MGVIIRKLRHIFLPLFGFFFASQLIFAPTPVMADDSQSAQATSQTTSSPTCYDQLGGVGWLACPIISVSSNAIDAIYNIITDLLKINPSVTSDTESPIYIIWEYVRNITNIVFIIFLLISIYSQVTGFGMSNYGVKRVLPRLIISALLVNLSFIICALAVDVSNILGISIYGFFESVRDSTIGANTTNIQVDPGQAILALLGIAPIAGASLAVGVAAAGGIAGLLFAAIPVIVGGLISIIAALITVMLRQGVIALLIMIAPLAFVAFLLPNTEKWFTKWRDLLIRMLVFYPMFAALFGAANLAGWAIMTSANGNPFWSLVGFAVQILPLFLAVSLMKMSGTILGTVNDKLNKLKQPAVGGLRNWSDSHRALRRARYLDPNNRPNRFNLPRRTAQFLDRRRDRRATDTAAYDSARKDANIAYAANRFRRNGQMTSRGRRLYSSEIGAEEARANTERLQNIYDNNLMDRNNFRTQRQADQFAANVARRQAARTMVHDVTSVARQAQLQEVATRYHDSHNAIIDNANGKFNARFAQMQSIAGTTGQQGINSIVSGAISAQAKASKEALGDYEALYEHAVFSKEIYDEIDAAFASKNPIALRASLQALVNRGEYDTITKKLRLHTSNLAENTPEDRAMQQAIQDVMLQIKVNDILKGYGKSLAKGRNKGNGLNSKLTDGDIEYSTFIPFLEYEHPEINDDPAHGALGLGVDQYTILRTNNNADVAAVQDKTLWVDAKEHNARPFTHGQLRYALFNKPTDGETYQCMIDTQLGAGAKWQDPETRHILTFKSIPTNPTEFVEARTSQQALAEAQSQVREIIRGLNSSQLAKFTPDAFEAFATILSHAETTDGDTITFDNSDANIRRQNLIRGVQAFAELFPPRLVKDLEKQSNQGRLGEMDPEIREILNEVLHFERD